MPSPPASRPATARPRGADTRGLILREAERCFARRGFAATRLEDVAEAVGIRRASIVYHFRDKQELYDAVLESAFGALRERVEQALMAPGPASARIEGAIGAWVDAVGERPALARLLLREVADADPDRRMALLAHLEPFRTAVMRFLASRAPEERPAFQHVDPAHLASTIAGATVFFVAAMPALVPDMAFDPLSPEHLARHKDEVLRIARRFLGTDRPRRVRPTREDRR